MSAVKAAVIKSLSIVVIGIVGGIVYVSNSPTSDEDIIISAERACIFETNLHQAKLEIAKCMDAKKITADIINNCTASALGNNGLRYDVAYSDKDAVTISSSDFSKYREDKVTGRIPLSNGTTYKPDCSKISGQPNIVNDNKDTENASTNT